MRLLVVEPRSTAGLLFPSLYPCGMILLALYLMVYDWPFFSATPMIFYWNKLRVPLFCLLLFFDSHLSFSGLVLWGWGLRTHRVSISLSQPCIAAIFQ